MLMEIKLSQSKSEQVLVQSPSIESKSSSSLSQESKSKVDSLNSKDLGLE